MSPRRHRRRASGLPDAPWDGQGLGRTEEWADGTWRVRPVAGARPGKSYRCPGCDQEIVAGTPHLVAWPVDGFGGLEDRRHWHSPCWRNRMRRRPE